MTKPRSEDYAAALALLRAAFGECNPKQPLRKLFELQPNFGKFEWMLTIIGLEIDLRLDIPESLADNLKLTVDEFCHRVAALPKVDAPGYTLECLSLVAQALLCLEPPEPEGGARATTRAVRQPAKAHKQREAKRAIAQRASTPSKRAAVAKRAAGRAPSANEPAPKERRSRRSIARPTSE